jgi:hypothetical protein
MKTTRILTANLTVGLVLCLGIVVYLGLRMRTVTSGSVDVSLLGIPVATSTRIPLADGGSSVPLSFGPGMLVVLLLPTLVLTPLLLLVRRRRQAGASSASTPAS